MKLVFDPLLGGGGDQNSTERVKFCVGICLAYINLVLGGQLAPPKKKRFFGHPNTHASLLADYVAMNFAACNQCIKVQ